MGGGKSVGTSEARPQAKPGSGWIAKKRTLEAYRNELAEIERFRRVKTLESCE